MDGLEADSPTFSPSGEWLAVGGFRPGPAPQPRRAGSAGLGDYPNAGVNGPIPLFGPASDLLIVARLGELRAWSIPDGRELWRRQGPHGFIVPFPADDGFLTMTFDGPRWLVHAWPLDGSEPRLVGPIENAEAFGLGRHHLVYRVGRRMFVRTLARWNPASSVGGELPADSADIAISPDGSLVAASDGRGEIRVWPTTGPATRPLRVFRAEGTPRLMFDEQGRRLAAAGVQDGGALARVFDLHAPPGAAPVALRRADSPYVQGFSFDPTGRWLAIGHVDATSLWALDGPRPHVLKR